MQSDPLVLNLLLLVSSTQPLHHILQQISEIALVGYSILVLGGGGGKERERVLVAGIHVDVFGFKANRANPADALDQTSHVHRSSAAFEEVRLVFYSLEGEDGLPQALDLLAEEFLLLAQVEGLAAFGCLEEVRGRDALLANLDELHQQTLPIRAGKDDPLGSHEVALRGSGSLYVDLFSLQVGSAVSEVGRSVESHYLAVDSGPSAGDSVVASDEVVQCLRSD